MQAGSPGLAIFAASDGGFSTWDPLRSSETARSVQLPKPLHFTAESLWNGLSVEGHVQCNGLIQDWIYWQQGWSEQDRRLFSALEALLALLSPPGEPIRVAEPGRIVGDARRYPMLKMPFETLPVTHASSALKRILGLAYLLLWTWNEHTVRCEQAGVEPTRELVLLIDELELHLHPRWQRSLLRALLGVTQHLLGGEALGLQLLIVTHSPLVLASAEPHFDDTRDAWFALELDREDSPCVRVQSQAFTTLELQRQTA